MTGVEAGLISSLLFLYVLVFFMMGRMDRLEAKLNRIDAVLASHLRDDSDHERKES